MKYFDKKEIGMALEKALRFACKSQIVSDAETADVLKARVQFASELQAALEHDMTAHLMLDAADGDPPAATESAQAMLMAKRKAALDRRDAHMRAALRLADWLLGTLE